MSAERVRALTGRARAALGVAVFLLAFSHAAEARVVTLLWSHPTPANVAGFNLHYGTSSGSYSTTVNIGKPAASGGVFTHDLTVGDTVTVYVALSAYGTGYTESFLSNQKTFSAPTAPPPTDPTPPPTDPTPPPTDPTPPPTTPSTLIPLPSGTTSTWSQDFQTSATGTYVPGWRDTGADNSLTESDGLFSVFDLAGSRVFGTSSSLVNIHSHLASTGADQWSSYGLQGRMLITDAAGGIGVTAYSQYPNADVYYRLRRHDGQPFHVSPHPDGAAISCSPATTGVVPAANTWYRFRFEVASGSSSNTIRAKVWRNDVAEPGSWQTTCTDTRSDRPTGGTIGVWSMRSGQKAWDDLTVYRAGGSTPSPTAPPMPPILLPID